MKKIVLVLALVMLSGCVARTVYLNKDGQPVAVKTEPIVPEITIVQPEPAPVVVYEEVWRPGIWIIDVRGHRHWRHGYYERRHRH